VTVSSHSRDAQRLQHGRLLCGVGDVEVGEKADDRQAGIGRVEEGTVAVVGAPIRPRSWRQPLQEAGRPLVGGCLVLGLAGRQAKLRGGEQRAVVVDDVLLAVVRESGVALREKRPGVLGGAKVLGAAFPRDLHRRGAGQCSDRHARS